MKVNPGFSKTCYTPSSRIIAAVLNRLSLRRPYIAFSVGGIRFRKWSIFGYYDKELTRQAIAPTSVHFLFQIGSHAWRWDMLNIQE